MKFYADPASHPVRFWGSVSALFLSVLLCLGALTLNLVPAGQAPPDLHPGTVWEHGSADLAGDLALAWVQEAQRRYPDEPLIVVFVHGNTHEVIDPCTYEVISREWRAYPFRSAEGVPMTEIVKRMRDRYGAEKRVILVSCNPDALPFNEARVTYALKSVWVVPDYQLSVLENAARDHLYDEGDLPGDIDEFIEND